MRLGQSRVTLARWERTQLLGLIRRPSLVPCVFGPAVVGRRRCCGNVPNIAAFCPRPPREKRLIGAGPLNIHPTEGVE